MNIATTAEHASESSVPRSYRMKARSDAVAVTRERILQAAYDLWLERPYHEVTIGAVATAAGVTRQTVIRQFGSKDDLAVAVVDWQRPIEEASRVAEPGDVAMAIDRLVDRYETMGDANVRLLELEGRVDAIDYILTGARESHRAWIEHTLAPHVGRKGSKEREHVVLALYAVTDVTLWKLLRRDFGQPVSDVQAIIQRLVDGVLRTVDTTKKEHTR